MDEKEANARKLTRQREIVKLTKQYIEDGNVLNLIKFKQENRKIYNRINYNFGSIDGLIKMVKHEYGEQLIVRNHQAIMYDLDTLTLRNNLAYEHLKELRREYTLQEIADYFGVTRQLINQMWQTLKGNIEEHK